MNETLNTYRQEAERYRDLTGYGIDQGLKNWLASAVKGLPARSKVFELGSGHGRDALYLKENYSLSIRCSDAVPEFVSMLQEAGLKAELWNAEMDELPSGMDMYLANAVLLHFSQERVKALLREAYLKLPLNGKFAFTLKKGLGSETISAKLSGPRFFNYWLPKEILGAVVDAGFEDLELIETDVWLHCVAVKRSSNRY